MARQVATVLIGLVLFIAALLVAAYLYTNPSFFDNHPPKDHRDGYFQVISQEGND